MIGYLDVAFSLIVDYLGVSLWSSWWPSPEEVEGRSRRLVVLFGHDGTEVAGNRYCLSWRQITLDAIRSNPLHMP
jgi:hypothetical protein